jgi:hypothetical protein
LLIGLSLAGPIPAAEPTNAQREQDSADALIEQGIALRRSNDDEQALDLFRRAEQLAPDSMRVKVHLAAAYQALGQWEEADHYLSAALANPADPYVQRYRSTLATARQVIDRHMGTLQLSGGPPGTEVRLNGRTITTLPMRQPVRLAAGIYTLEARLAGHYSITRSVTLTGGALSRESISLAPFDRTAPPAPLEDPPPTRNGVSWLTWTFGGLALGAGALTVGAYIVREQHADRWNDDSVCTSPSQTREQLCGKELESGQEAQTWMWVGGISMLAFTGAAITSLWLGNEQRSQEPELSLRCGVGLAQLSCTGRF